MKRISRTSIPLGEWVLTLLAIVVVGIAGFSLLTAQPAVAQHKTILVVAPHPDDETLCCAGVIYSALQQGNTVYIAVITNGDAGSTGTSFGLQREAETIAGVGVLGLGPQNVIFLGYGDQSLQGLYQSTSPSTIMTSEAGETQTYANTGLGGMSYHQYLYGVPGNYNRQTILADVEALLQNIKPSDIYTTGLWDDHPDHEGTFNFLVEGLLDLRRAGGSLSPRIHETLIHAPDASDGVPSNGNYLWPGGGVGVVPTFYPTQPYPEPYYLSSATPYEWDNIENIPVPAVMQNPVQTANLKAQAISQYVSQGGDEPENLLFAWSKKNEWFWIRDFVTNVAGLATVTASSDTPDAGEVAASAVDGFIEGYPGYAPWEWASNGQLAGAWITLTWPSAVTISNVVLYNRQDDVDDVLSGTLSFSDGSKVAVGQLPINGNGSLLSFSPRTVTSMTFTVNNAVGQNIGLTEIEVFGEPAGTTINHPQIFKGPVASTPLGTDQWGQQYVASISDSQTTNLGLTAFDVGGGTLSYSWTTDAGVISGSGSTVTYIPPVVSSPTITTSTVTVSDGAGGTTQNSVFISVVPSDSLGIVPSSLVLSPTTVSSGSSAVGTVSLNHTAPDGAIVALTSSNPAVASVPATVTIAPGSSSATFSINTIYVYSNTSVSVSASVGSGTQSATLNVQAPSAYVSSVAVSPTTIGGGNPATGTITLTGPAPTGGAVVNLSSSNTSVATVPSSTTIAAGATSGTFTVTTQSLTSPTTVTLSTSYVGLSSSTSLRIAPYVPPNLATIATVSVSSQDTAYQQQGIKAIDGIVDGSPSPGDYTKEWATNGQLAGAWITLTWSAPVTATSVVLYDRPNLTDNVTGGTLSFSDGSTVPVGALPNNGNPLTVSFSAKTVTSMTFTITSAVGQNIGLAEIAVIGTVNPATQISSTTVTPATLIGGISAIGTVTLNGAAASGGTVVTLASNNTSAATVPSTVTVPAGMVTATFPVTTYSVNASTEVSITGTYGGTQSAPLTVNPVSMSAFSLTPSMVVGGSASSTGLVNLDGPAPTGGAVIALSSTNTAAAKVPASITIPAGSTSGGFTVTTTAVSATATVTIGASYEGQENATLLVTPQVPGGGGMVEFALDSFNRANGTTGPNWTTIMDADSSPMIQAQQIQSVWGRAKSLYYGGLSWPADQYSQVQILASNGGSSGPTVRMTSYGNYYAGTIGSLGNGNANVYILIDSQESQSVLASSSSATVLAGDYIQLSVKGSTLTMTDVTRSETLLTATDSTLPAGYPGMYVADGGTVANWSGGLDAQPPAITTLASDNFNRANSPTLGSNWSIGPGYYAIQIINDQIESAGQGQPPGQGHGKEYYTGATFPSDQWSQAQVMSTTNDVNGAIVRYQGTVDTHYVGFVSNFGGPGACSVSIDRDIAGAPVVLATDSTYCSVSSGDFIRLQVQGSLLSYIDVTTGSLLLTTLDSQITGGSPGWSLNPNGGTPIATNWSGGQVGP